MLGGYMHSGWLRNLMVMDKPVQVGQGMAGRGMAGRGMAGRGMFGPPFDLFVLTFSSFIFPLLDPETEKQSNQRVERQVYKNECSNNTHKITWANDYLVE